MTSHRPRLARVLSAAGVSCAVSIAAAEPRLIYSNDFQNGAGPEWSATQTAATPVGQRRFLGPFGREAVTLTLPDVPRHSHVTLAFDLYIIGSWDGNYDSPTAGPDIWQVRVGDQAVTRTTFNTHTFAGQWQAFPDEFPTGQHPSNTGAAEVGTLGYPCSGSCTNAVYHLEWLVGDSAQSIVLELSAANLEAIANESWGIDNITIWLDGTPADLNHDWYVDLLDYEGFQICMKGPGRPPSVYCPVDADLDYDGDVDLADFQPYQVEFCGSERCAAQQRTEDTVGSAARTRS